MAALSDTVLQNGKSQPSRQNAVGTRLPRCLIWLLLSWAPLPALCQTQASLQREIGKLIHFETDVGFPGKTGLIVGVVDGNSTFVCAFGTFEKETPGPATHSLFELGDLTQVITAALVLQQVNEGILHLNTPLNEYLPPGWQNKSAHHLTIRNLLTHTSGLPRVPPGFGKKITGQQQPYAHYSKDDLLAFYRSFDFGEAGTKYHYSPVNFALLEIALENATGKPFGELLAAQVLLPLGMADTHLYLHDSEEGALARGFSRAGLPAEAWQFQSFGAALGLKSSMEDLLRFLQSVMDGDATAPMELGKNGGGLASTGIRKDTWVAAGWHIIRRRRRPNIVTHTGWTNGHRTAMAYLYGTRKGVVILSNTSDGLDGLEFRVLDLLWESKKK
ncbi:MAG: serine hydrolase domain-containing protein [Saprospiraceae bacterium]